MATVLHNVNCACMSTSILGCIPTLLRTQIQVHTHNHTHRVNNAKSRHELAQGIKAAYHFENKPADVIHWDTVANMSDYLDEYVEHFAEGCMQYRHFRFHRSKISREVIMQVSLSMLTTAVDDCSGKDANDPWRGLKPQTTHSVVFGTAKGVPDFYQDFKEGNLPAAQMRPPNKELHALMHVTVNKLANHFPSFNSYHLEDCHIMLALFIQPPAPFPWTNEHMARVFDPERAASEQDAVPDTAEQSQMESNLPMPARDDFVLCRPADPEDGEERDRFWLGRVKKVHYLNQTFICPFIAPHQK
jgi:hypothetical protein